MRSEVNIEKLKKTKTNFFSLKSSLIIALSYFLISVIWIFADRVITLLHDDLEVMFQIHTYKSLLFFVMTSIFIFVLVYKSIKKIDNKLEQSEKRYRNLIEFLPDAVIAWNENGEIISANLSANKLLGYRLEEEMIGKTIFDIIHYDFHEVVRDRIRGLITKKEKTISPIEMMGIKKDGTIIDIEVQSAYLDFKTEMVLVTVARDITERKQKESDIKMLSQAVEQGFSMVMIFDKEGKIEYVNPNFTEVSGFNLEDIIGKNPDVLDAKKQPKELRENMWQTIRSGHRWRGELFNRAKNGLYYWVDTSISPVKDKNNQVVNYVTVQSDITANKRMIHELELKNKQLNCMLRQLKETQSQLIQREKMAGIGQLAAGVAHEINNPLGYISGNFNVLKKYFNSYKQILEQYKRIEMNHEKLSKGDLKLIIDKIKEMECEKNIDFINQDLELLFKETNHGLDRVKEIVMGLRVFSRVDQIDGFEDYDLNDGIKNTLIIALNEIKYHAEVVADLKEIPIISARGGEINQVLLNLIVNAAHGTKIKKSNETSLIKISTYNDDEYVYCEIEDNGIGIPSENLFKIFDPFYTTKPVGEGTGLGLSIAYNIIRNKHKGDIWVESKVGVGTKFAFKLPLSQAVLEE